jgi:hypothetical protein
LHGALVIESVVEGWGEWKVEEEVIKDGEIVKFRSSAVVKVSFFECIDSESTNFAGSSEPQLVWHKAVGTEFRNTEQLRRDCMTCSSIGMNKTCGFSKWDMCFLFS